MLDVSIRKDDGAVVLKTDAYVSHRANRGTAWTSQFSMTPEEARQLRTDLDKLLGCTVATAKSQTVVSRDVDGDVQLAVVHVSAEYLVVIAEDAEPPLPETVTLMWGATE